MQKKMNDVRFPILFATDAEYVPHLAAAIISLLQNNLELKLKIIVFTAGIPEVDKEKLRAIANSYKTPLVFQVLDESRFVGLILNHHFKKSNYYRLFAANYISEERCLYLDADLIVNCSIKEIINIDLCNAYLAAVEDGEFSRHKQLKMHPSSKYFNSGVMLINLEKWRSVDLVQLVIEFVRKYPEVIHFVDQCGLNAIVDGKWISLESRFNTQTFMLNNTPALLSVNRSIIHFTGSSKPWQMSNKHPFKSIYWEYRNKTMYKSCVPDDFSFFNLMRYVMPSVIKRNFRKLMK
jgi:lipopolysaccharide biosynthesis glycosyltransferase